MRYRRAAGHDIGKMREFFSDHDISVLKKLGDATNYWPSLEQRKAIQPQTSLTLDQITKWFITQRNRQCVLTK
jgi:hypothetical protein